MAESAAFEFVADELDRTLGLGRAAARRVVRSALARALFDPHSVTASQLRSVVERLLPEEIARSGVADAETCCRQLAARLAGEPFSAADPESPDEIFGRLIRR